MLRAFLAIDLPAGLRPPLARVLQDLQAAEADVRWVPVGNIHLTLKFFGQITEAQVEAIAAAASQAAVVQASFTLTLAGAGAFPTPKSPRVIWLGVGGDLPTVREFHRRLEAAFAPLGFPPEERPFAPHLTLGRVKSPRGRLELARRLGLVQPPEVASFQVQEIILFRSNLTPQGATYVPLKVIGLGSDQ